MNTQSKPDRKKLVMRYATSPSEAANMRRELDALIESERAAATAPLRELLAKVEWRTQSGEESSCLFCYERYSRGHADDCRLAALKGTS